MGIAILQKLLFPQIVRKLPVFFGSRWLTTVLTAARY